MNDDPESSGFGSAGGGGDTARSRVSPSVPASAGLVIPIINAVRPWSSRTAGSVPAASSIMTRVLATTGALRRTAQCSGVVLSGPGEWGLAWAASKVCTRSGVPRCAAM